MAQSTAGRPSVMAIGYCTDNPATGYEARGDRILALEAVLGATVSQGVVGDRPEKTQEQDVTR